MYHRRDQPYKAAHPRSGYPKPLRGYNVVESIKDTHMYEKPDAISLGYPTKTQKKDYNAIRASYQAAASEKEFKKAYAEIQKEVNDDYTPSKENEFEKFSKSFDDLGNGDDIYTYKFDTKDTYGYKAEKDPATHQKPQKQKMKYKETRYDLPKPNKYGEVKDVPVEYKQPKYEPPRYATKHQPKNHNAQYAPAKYAVKKYRNEYQREATKYDEGHEAEFVHEPTKKAYKPEEEFDRFYNRDSKSSYPHGGFRHYGVGYVEKASPKGHAALKEKIHGSHYITQSESK